MVTYVISYERLCTEIAEGHIELLSNVVKASSRKDLLFVFFERGSQQERKPKSR